MSIEIFDENLTKIYSSIDKDSTPNQTNIECLKYVMNENKATSHICSDIYSLSIKSLVPIQQSDKTIALLVVTTHFNSISFELASQSIDSLVILNKRYSEDITKPLSGVFMGDYYVANHDASIILMDYVKQNGVDNFINSVYYTNKSYLSTAYELKNYKNSPIGYFILFKNIKDIDKSKVDQNATKNTLYFTIIVLLLLLMVIFYMLKKEINTTLLYKKIVDFSQNIIIVVTKDEIIEANNTFFKYFNDFQTLNEFKQKYKSFSDLFAREDGYICKRSDHFCWIEHILNNPNDNKIKLLYNESFYYFSVDVSFISKEKGLYSVILRDVTKEEVYKKELEVTNITDTLTKVKNRYFYNLQLKKECANANRYFYPLSLVIFDIDFFKKVNDIYGHDKGDAVLIEYTKLISTYLRDGDILCRIGGEEFALILPHTTKAGAFRLADKLRLVVQEHRVILPITMSFGVVEYKKGEDLELTFKRADEALYEAKRGGRNKVVVR